MANRREPPALLVFPRSPQCVRAHTIVTTDDNVAKIKRSQDQLHVLLWSVHAVIGLARKEDIPCPAKSVCHC